MSWSFLRVAFDATPPLIVDTPTPCQDDPDLWFADKGQACKARFSDEQLEAIAGCNRCPVRDECLLTALANREEWGIWGGKSPDERRRILRTEGAA